MIYNICILFIIIDILTVIICSIHLFNFNVSKKNQLFCCEDPDNTGGERDLDEDDVWISTLCTLLGEST